MSTTPPPSPPPLPTPPRPHLHPHLRHRSHLHNPGPLRPHENPHHPKKHTPPSSLPRLPNNSSNPLLPWWPQERLRNEAATLTFIASNTTIPVPSCRLYSSDDGLLHLEMTRIREGVLLLDVDPGARGAAVQAVDAQMEAEILPQLRRFRRGYVGSVDDSLPVCVPAVEDLWG